MNTTNHTNHPSQHKKKDEPKNNHFLYHPLYTTKIQTLHGRLRRRYEILTTWHQNHPDKPKSSIPIHKHGTDDGSDKN